MVNEEILTSLRNAVEHGESLQEAINLAINSGYNPREVQEASQFVGGGIINNFQPAPNEQLTMPSQKNIPTSMQRIQEPQFQTIQSTKNYVQQNPQAIKQNIADGSVLSSYSSPYPSQGSYQSLPNSQQSFSNQLSSLSPPRQSYAKEIILLIILLLLIGALISTIWFKEQILNFLSSFQQA